MSKVVVLMLVVLMLLVFSLVGCGGQFWRNVQRNIRRENMRESFYNQNQGRQSGCTRPDYISGALLRTMDRDVGCNVCHR